MPWRSIGGQWRAVGGTWQGRKTPASLFENGEQGAWYDPSDLSTLFQDDAGSTPVTEPGQTVGFVTDRSGNDKHATQATVEARPIYGIVPATGRRNLLDNTDLPGIQQNGSTQPDGSIQVGQVNIPVHQFTPDPVDGVVTGPGKSYPNAVGVDVTLSVFVLPKTNRYIYISSNSLGTQPNVGTKYRYDTQTDAVVQLFDNNTLARSSRVENLGNGLYRCTISWRPRSTAGSKVFSVFCTNELNDFPGSTRISPADTTLALPFSHGGWQAEGLGDAALNPLPTPYQRVGSQFDVTEPGVRSLHYLFGDGVDDSLTATLPDIGAGATVAYATDQGVTILTGQTIGAGAYNILRDERLYAHLVIDRALTAQETAQVQVWLEEKAGI